MNAIEVESRLVSALEWAKASSIPLIKLNHVVDIFVFTTFTSVTINPRGVDLMTLLMMHALTFNEPKVRADVGIERNSYTYVVYRMANLLGLRSAQVMDIVEGWNGTTYEDCSEWMALGYKLGCIHEPVRI